MTVAADLAPGMDAGQSPGADGHGFLEWIAGQAERDGIDHILFLSREARLLRGLAEIRHAVAAQPALPGFSCLEFEETDLLLSTVNERNFEASLPALVASAGGIPLTAWLKRLGCEVPAAHVLRDLGLGEARLEGAATRPEVLQFLRAWKARLLQRCRAQRRRLLQQLLAAGLRPGHRVALAGTSADAAIQEAFSSAVSDLISLNVSGYFWPDTGSPAGADRYPANLRG